MKKQLVRMGILVGAIAMISMLIWQTYKKESQALVSITMAGEDVDVFLPAVLRPPTTFYVSKSGNNQDGLSWQTAWNELDQIDWDVIGPGSSIMIDGGTVSAVYNTTLELQKSGTANKPIIIQLSPEDGRNGQAIIFGGRSTMLPYCGQATYEFQTENVNSYGILVNNSSWIVVDGTKWRGIVIYGHNQHGLRFYSQSNNVTMRNLEIYDNGEAVMKDGAWEPDGAGIRIAGKNNTFERLIVHDNGHDAIQAGTGPAPDTDINNLENFTIRESWLYNGRPHPTIPESFNYCGHSDGVQLHTGGTIDGVLIEKTIIGPAFTNGVLLGQTLTPSGANAVVNNVTLRDVLFTKMADNGIRGYAGTQPDGWVIDQVTAHCPATKGPCIYIEGTNHSVTNSIFVGSMATFPDALSNFSNNCQWELEGFDLGLEANPLFTNVSDSDPFSLDNYMLMSGSPCAGMGTTIWSVDQLFSLP